jgi:hypothetical protein
VDVTLSNPGLKAELDRTMDRLGYEFVGAGRMPSVRRGGALSFPVPGGPPAAGSGAPDTLSIDGFEDRPTPVALAAEPALAPAGVPPIGLEPLEPLSPNALDAAFEELVAGTAALPDAFAESPAPKAEPLPGIARFLVALPLVLSLGVQVRALFGTLGAEDFVELFAGVSRGFFQFLTKLDLGPTTVVERFAYFVVHRIAGLRSWAFLLLPLALHLVAVVLLHDLLVRLTRRPYLAAAVAALWGMSALHQGTLSAFSSFGEVVAVVAGFAIVRDLVALSGERRPPPPFALARWVFLVLFAGASSTSGVGLVVALPILARLSLPEECGRRRAVLALSGSAGAVLVGYALYRVLGPEHLGRFTSGVSVFFDLVPYGAALFFPGPVIAVARGGAPAGAAGSPDAAIIVSIVGLVAFAGVVAWAMVRADASERRRLAALFVVPGAVYAFVAFDAAHLIKVHDAAWLSTRPEAQYVATFGLALVLARAFPELPRLDLGPPWLAPIALSAVLALLAVPSAFVAARMDGGTGAATQKSVDAARTAISAVVGASPPGKDLYVWNTDFPAVSRSPVGRDRVRFPGLFAYFVLAHPQGEMDGRKVFFVEADPKLLSSVKAAVRPEVAALLVGAEDAQKAKAQIAVTALDTEAGTRAAPSPVNPARAPRDRRRGKLPFRR